MADSIKRGEITLVDVREPEEFEEGRIADCKLIPLGELQTRATQELKPEADIVVYCAHGVRSVHGVMALRNLGYARTRSMAGGICAWEEAGFPVSK